MLKIHRFDPSGCSFPPAIIPVLPRIRGAAFVRRSHESGTARQQSYSRGRYALRDAYHLCGVGAQGALLAPAYHCRTMIDPAISLGAEVALYPVTHDLEPDMARLASAAASAATPVRALLFTHFFGFPRSIAEAVRFCTAYGIALIEDCSHVWLPAATHAGVGARGRYAVSSYYKFVPSQDGALLHANSDAPLPPGRRGPPARHELAALVRLLRGGGRHTTLASRQPPDANPIAGVDCARQWIESTNTTSPNYKAADEGKASLRSSSWILRRTDSARLAQRRRQRYGEWLAAVRDIPGCRPLFPALPEHCVPYMFPLLLDIAEPHFTRLKRMGMPIWRWDEMALSDCSTAAHYRLALLHLPCHQSLRDDEMSWMTTAVGNVLRSGDHGANT